VEDVGRPKVSVWHNPKLILLINKNRTYIVRLQDANRLLTPNANKLF
jgi:hypothetical protein